VATRRVWKTRVKQRNALDQDMQLLPGYDPVATAGDCWFDYDEGQRAIDFFPAVLTHVKGEWSGEPLVLAPWQRGMLANLFGWKRVDGTRRYRQLFLYVPRKNAKTTIAAGIALYLLFCDGEPGAEIYSAAANEEQAALCFDTAKGMVEQSPALAKRGSPFRRVIAYEAERSRYVVLSAKASTKHGLNPSGVVIDELHAHKDRELSDTLTSAVGSRRQPLVIFTTTADYGRPSFCNETYTFACQVRDRLVEDSSFLPVIYEASRDDDWTAEATWRKANPNYGVSVKPDFIKGACQKAKDSPANENTFKRLHLNVITEQADRWLALEVWDRGAEGTSWEGLLEQMRGRACWCGLDLASTRDLAAFVMVFPAAGPDEPTVLVPVFWCPRDTAIEREHKDRIPYALWGAQGALRMTPGNVIDYDVIRRDIVALGEVVNIREIAIDRWASAQISNQLAQDGFAVVAFGQGFASMSAPTKELEKIAVASQLRHGGHPVLRFCAANVAIEGDAAGNMKPSKKRSAEKIDGIVAAIMGVGAHLAHELTGGPSVYESGGIFTV